MPTVESRTAPPTSCHPYTQKQSDTAQPTDQNGCDGSMKIRHGDRGGERESGNPANERAAAILSQEPPQLRERENCGHHPKDAADDGATEEPKLPCCASKGRPDRGTQACQRPSSEG